MKILVVGSGAREHALVWKIAQSSHAAKIFCAPGNGGISGIAECIDIRADDIAALAGFARRQRIDLTVVGPEAPLAAGIVDEFQAQGLKIFGPAKAAARLEASKGFAKKFMQRHKIPTAEFVVSSTPAATASAIRGFGAPVVVKADGLAAGKGVVVAATEQEAIEAARRMQEERIFGVAGDAVVVERCLQGEEASILVLTDGCGIIPLASAQDYKRVFEKDEGPNTGGMGAYSPAPVVTSELFDDIMRSAITPAIDGMRREGMRYRGVLYAGIMVTDDGPQVLEFNVRFGDPETEAVLPRMESDLVEAMLWTIGGSGKPEMKWSAHPSVSVVVSSGGYPGRYEAGKVVTGLEKAGAVNDAIVFHAGTKLNDKKEIVTAGGRVLAITGMGADLKAAADNAYAAVGAIQFEKMHFRRDIARRAMRKVVASSEGRGEGLV